MSNTNKLYKLIKLLPNSTIDNFHDKINENTFIGTTDFENILKQMTLCKIKVKLELLNLVI